MITCNQRKTLSDLARLFHLTPDPKTLADFFRESPWTVDLVGEPRKQFMLQKCLELAAKAGMELKILASLDDSLGKKGKATQHLEAVDYYHNHTESSKKRQSWSNGYVYVDCILRSVHLVSCSIHECTCERRKCGVSIADVPKRTVSPIAANTTWPVKCCSN
jgi:hypothetical protein